MGPYSGIPKSNHLSDKINNHLHLGSADEDINDVPDPIYPNGNRPSISESRDRDDHDIASPSKGTTNRFRINSYPPYTEAFDPDDLNKHSTSSLLTHPPMTKIRLPSFSSSNSHSHSIFSSQSPANHTSDSNKSSPSLMDHLLKNNIVIERVSTSANNNSTDPDQDDSNSNARMHSESSWHYTSKKSSAAQCTKVYGMDHYTAKRLSPQPMTKLSKSSISRIS